MQSNYIPWKGYFDYIALSDVFVIYDDVQYTKNDWRNRNLIKTPSGLQWLTIPVFQTSHSQLICETRILKNNWQRKHRNALLLNYGKSPYFNHLKDDLFGLYDADSAYLSEINRSFIQSICRILGIATQIIDSRDLKAVGDRNTRLVQICRQLNAETYLSAPAAKSYLDVSLFKAEGINVEWMDYSGYKEYPQGYGSFQHNVSILDLLFNTGEAANSYMKFTTRETGV